MRPIRLSLSVNLPVPLPFLLRPWPSASTTLRRIRGTLLPLARRLFRNGNFGIAHFVHARLFESRA